MNKWKWRNWKRGIKALIQAMIRDKKLGVTKKFHTVPDVTYEKAALKTMLFQFKFLSKKCNLNIISFVNKSSIYPEKTKEVWRLSYHLK